MTTKTARRRGQPRTKRSMSGVRLLVNRPSHLPARKRRFEMAQ